MININSSGKYLKGWNCVADGMFDFDVCDAASNH